MIQTLRVRNLAVIEELDLELGPGLTVLTGETGAGKSVLLWAVALLCGRRVSSEAIRAGCDEARVEAIITSPRALERARERGLLGDGEEELLVVRTLSRNGRGRVLVNGALATAALLAELLGDEIEVTSQGEHQRLLRSELQGQLLDDFGELQPLLSACQTGHERWRALACEIHERRTQAEERARREDRLRFELEQIEAVDPQAGELESLERDHRRLAHLDALTQRTGAALDRFESDGGIREQLAAARRELDSARELDATLDEACQGIARAEVELEEAARALEQYRTALEAEPDALLRVEARLGELGRLQSRYGGTVEEILAHRDAARAQLESLEGGEARLKELETEQAAAAAALETAATALEKARRQTGLELAGAVQKELRGLELGRAEFAVAFDALPRKTPEGFEAPSGPHGRERAAFTLAANPGEPARRLRDAASGGELARLLLALRNVLRETTGGGVLLFDEIDAGISGRTASRVGDRLRALARSHQILCITHLASIAATAEAHYRIAKRVRGGRTRTIATQLDPEARVDEIARMSGGGRLTDAARAHARELLAG